MVSLGHVDECVDVVIVSFHVLVLDQPLELLLDHLFRGQEHILEDVDQLGLQQDYGDCCVFVTLNATLNFTCNAALLSFLRIFMILMMASWVRKMRNCTMDWLSSCCERSVLSCSRPMRFIWTSAINIYI